MTSREALLQKAREWLDQHNYKMTAAKCAEERYGLKCQGHDSADLLADFCLSELAAQNAETSRIEQLLRREWWLHHGCPFGVYGDDGEMQCAMCGRDFKRMPLDQLELHTQLHRMGRALQREGQ